MIAARVSVILLYSAVLYGGQACSAPEYHQFDFWIGDWDVFDSGGSTPVAHVRVDPILDGCVLREQYEGATGSKGQSFSIWDASRKVWHQTWMTDHGRLLEIEGTLRNGSMVLSGADRRPDGKLRQVRGKWTPAGNDVRETADTSIDDAKTWQPWFDLIFRPRSRP